MTRTDIIRRGDWTLNTVHNDTFNSARCASSTADTFASRNSAYPSTTETILMQLDMGRFVVLHLCSPFSDCCQLATPQNAFAYRNRQTVKYRKLFRKDILRMILSAKYRSPLQKHISTTRMSQILKPWIYCVLVLDDSRHKIPTSRDSTLQLLRWCVDRGRLTRVPCKFTAASSYGHVSLLDERRRPRVQETYAVCVPGRRR